MRIPTDRKAEVQLNNCNNMKLHHIKLLSFLLAVFLTSCKESTDTPPFVFRCLVKLVNEDGSLPLEENKDKTSEITINLIKPTDNNAQIENMLYLDYDGNLNIQILIGKLLLKMMAIMIRSIDSKSNIPKKSVGEKTRLELNIGLKITDPLS